MRHSSNREAAHAAASGLDLEAVIEVPRGSFVKRGSSGRIDFLSPCPAPSTTARRRRILGSRVTYWMRSCSAGACPRHPLARQGLECGDADGSRHSDDKLVCSSQSPSDEECCEVLCLFHFYARCKGMPNLLRRRPGRNGCDSWGDANEALAAPGRFPIRGRSPVPF
jgi:inorganic pyrophosphatase